MTSNRITLLILICISLHLVRAQIPIGTQFDLSGKSFHGYYDAINYNPDKVITRIHDAESYETGYCYDKTGNRSEGVIKYDSDKITFKKTKEGQLQKVYPESLQSFVMGVDSFIVIQNFEFRSSVKKKPAFAQFLAEIDNKTFVKYYHFTNSLGQFYGNQDPVVETYLVKEQGQPLWKKLIGNVPTLTKYFGHVPSLKKKIERNEFEGSDLISYIKTMVYYQKYLRTEPIYFDQYWQELRDRNESVYHAQITDYNDSTWTWEYYKDAQKLYANQYASSYPNVKNGPSIAYFSNGNPRRINEYQEGDLTDVKTYGRDGGLKMHYTYRKENSEDLLLRPQYLVVNDDNGNNVLSESLSSLDQVDTLNKKTHTLVFEGPYLNKSYWMKGPDTVFNVVVHHHDFKIAAIQRKLDNYLSSGQYDDAIILNAQGTLLTSLLIDPKDMLWKPNC